MSTAYSHKGIEIEFRESRSDFLATILGKRVAAPSLVAMKKKIDAAKAENFQTFTALREREYNDPKGKDLFKVTIVGKSKTASKWNRGAFVDDQGKHHSRLLPDTPEAIALWKTHEAARAAEQKAEEVTRAARDAIPYIEYTDAP